MKRKSFYIVVSFILMCIQVFAVPLPELSSDGAILIEPTTNTILYAKNAHETFYPASTTKILTSLLLAEDISPNTIITKTQAAINNVPSDSSHIGLAVGDKYTAYDGLHGILMSSDNFICYDMAIADAGSIENFAKKMNARAKLLGATSSNFVNPHGYHDPNHYTTPYDLSQIARGAFNNEVVARIAGTKDYDVTILNSDKVLPISHTALLYNPKSEFYNEHVISAKTGYHTPAKRTLVAKANYDDIQLIAVVMRTDAPNQFADINKLFEYGSSAFSLRQSEDGSYTLNNMTYSDDYEKVVENALELEWIIPSTRNYTTPITKREFIQTLQNALPTEYTSLLDGMILYNGASIYKENLPITRKEVAKISYDLLENMKLADVFPIQSNSINDLAEVSAQYDLAIKLITSLGIMDLDENHNFWPNETISFEKALKIITHINNIATRYTTLSYHKAS